jgi:hypothetical protein
MKLLMSSKKSSESPTAAILTLKILPESLVLLEKCPKSHLSVSNKRWTLEEIDP